MVANVAAGRIAAQLGTLRPAVMLAGLGVASAAAAALALPWTWNTLVAAGGLPYFVVDMLQAVVYCAVAGMLAARRTGGLVTPVLLGIGLSHAATAAAGQYANLWLSGVPMPAGVWAVWAESWLYLPGLVLAAGILPIVLPGDRRITRLRRILLVFVVTTAAAHTVVQALLPGPMLRDGRLPNPLGVPVAEALVPLFDATAVVGLVAGPVLLASLLRHSTGADRAAATWFLAGDLLLVAALLLDVTGIGAAALSPESLLPAGLQAATLPLLPLAILATSLRHQAFRLRVAVNHALVWSLLSAGIAAGYLAVTGWLGALLRTRTGLAGVAGRGGLRRDRVRTRPVPPAALADRLVYGDRGDPLAVLGDVAARLTQPRDDRSALATVASELVTRLRLAAVRIDLARATGWETAAARGNPGDDGAADGTPIALPLVYRGEIVGQVLAWPRYGEELGPAERSLLDRAADHLSAAVYAYRRDLDLARSREALVTAREEERRRLSRDLHDDLGPALAGIALGLRAAANTVHRGSPGDVAPLLDELAAQAAAAADDVRLIARDLRPHGVAELGLAGAIRQRVDAVRSTGQLAVELSTPDTPMPLPAAVEAAAYRVVVEALTNTLRHARARHCWITIAHHGNLTLEVSDDGVGLPTQRRNGVGLSAMEERAAQLGGSLYVGNRIPQGTTIRLTLPSTLAGADDGGGRG